GVTVVFRNLTLRGGMAHDDGKAGALAGDSDARGGGILNAGTLKLEDVVLGGGMGLGGGGGPGTADTPTGGSGQSAYGGGILSSGTVELLRSTLRFNFAIGGRGGAGADSGADPGGDGGSGGSGAGGGLMTLGGSALLDSSTVALNRAAGG